MGTRNTETPRGAHREDTEGRAGSPGPAVFAGLLFTVGLVLGCNGADLSPGGEVTGVIQGREFRSQRGAFAALADAPEVLLIKIPDSARMCEIASHGGDGDDMTWASVFACLDPADVVGEHQVLAGGGMHFPCTEKGLWAELHSRLAGGYAVTPLDAGLVTIERRTSQELAGRLALTIGSDSLTGSFVTSYCRGLDLGTGP